MTKSQKKSAILNEKPQVTPKSMKINKNPVKDKEPNKPTQSKIIKKIVDVLEKPAGGSKQSKILALLQRTNGATINEMAKAAGWQRHSVQGMMSGVLKKRLGLIISSEKEERGRVYRITGNVSRL